MEKRLMQVDQWAVHMGEELDNFRKWWCLGLERGEAELATNLTFSEWFDLFLHHTRRVILVEEEVQEPVIEFTSTPAGQFNPDLKTRDNSQARKKARAR